MQPQPFASMTAPLGSGREVPTSRLIRPPSWRAKAHDLLNRPSSSRAARNVQLGTLSVIVLSSLAFVLQSEPSLASWGGWTVLDTLVAIVFTAEYALRIFVAPDGRGDEVDEQDAVADAASGHYPRRYTSPAGTPWQARLRCALQPLVLVDLAAILPFWLGLLLFFLPDVLLSPIRVLRLVRILRMLRLAQESKELRTLALCVHRCMPALRLLLFFVALQVRRSLTPTQPRRQVFPRVFTLHGFLCPLPFPPHRLACKATAARTSPPPHRSPSGLLASCPGAHLRRLCLSRRSRLIGRRLSRHGSCLGGGGPLTPEYTRRARDARANSRLFAVHTGRRMVRRLRVRRA